MIQSMKVKLGIVLLLLLGFYACSNSDLSQEITECQFPDEPTVDAPLWVCGAQVEGLALSAVGSFNHKSSNIDFAKHQASASARVFLAQQIAADINAQVNNYIKSESSSATVDDNALNTVNELITSQITSQTLYGVKIYKQTTSPNGVLYVLVGFDEDFYNQYIDKIFHNSYQQKKQQWQQVLSKEQFDKLVRQMVNQDHVSD